MKKLINNPESYVDDMLEGVLCAHPGLRRIPDTEVIARAERGSKVAIVSGGGSGHEPAHAGYVGTGMLDAAVAGAVFTSPTPDQVFAAIQAVDSGQGVLLVIKNYTGDVLNFEMAAELAREAGIDVEQVIVNDDVAVDGSTYTVGRRGIAGTVFVHKMAGAAAESGASLSDVKRIAEKVVENVRSMGMAVAPCTVPANGRESFELAEDEIEIGIGIHGEPGTHRTQLVNANDTVDLLLNQIFSDFSLPPGTEVAVMLNGLGATPQSELYIAYRRVHQVLGNKGIRIHKSFVGEYMTSLEMAGFSISIVKLDEELKQYLDAPSDAAAWRT